jgi:hypothetical protein
MKPLHEIPIFESPYLRPKQIIFCNGRCGYGPVPHLHVGPDTSRHEILFHARLTPQDVRYLKALRIGVDLLEEDYEEHSPGASD